MDIDYLNNRHFKTRAVGQLWKGPLQDKGYDNRVMSLTFHEMEFKNSMEAQRYMDVKKRKYASTGQLTNNHSLKFVSRSDDF